MEWYELEQKMARVEQRLCPKDVAQFARIVDQGGIALIATVPGVFLPPEGTPMWLMLRRDRVFVFPRS